MNIKQLRIKADLTQRELGERLGVQSQTILKYEKEERKIPESIQRLIRYEFAEYLPEDERLIPGVHKSGNGDEEVSFEKYAKVVDEREILIADVEVLKEVAKGAKNLEKIIEMQADTINILKDQIGLYKDRIAMMEGKEPPSKTA